MKKQPGQLGPNFLKQTDEWIKKHPRKKIAIEDIPEDTSVEEFLRIYQQTGIMVYKSKEISDHRKIQIIIDKFSPLCQTHYQARNIVRALGDAQSFIEDFNNDLTVQNNELNPIPTPTSLH
jgi:plasmid rolling circle replication initiator protein Rep